MQLASTVFGIVLIAVGAVFWRWPGIFRRGIWMRTSIAIRSFSEENYARYMRTLAVLHVAAGVVLIVLSQLRRFR